MIESEKKILDMTCGGRSIWFNKNHPNAVYCDIRQEEHTPFWKSTDGKTERFLTVNPDMVCDFTNLPFADKTFHLVVFDPPHLLRAGETSWLVKKYGKLDENWPQMLHDGFSEGMRVLKENGVLIFKWNERDIVAEKVWKEIGQRPLFGHRSGKQSLTFWGCFMKGADAKKPVLNTIFPSGLEWYTCPSCGYEHVVKTEKYCQKCGQEMDWSDRN